MKVEETDRINKNWDDIWKGEDKEEIRQFLRKYSEIELPEFFNEQDIKNACNNIMIRIKNGDYDFGGILIKNSNTNFIDLMIYSLKTDDIKLLIEEREKLGLDSYIVRKMILGTKDRDYIKSCIEDRKKFNFCSYDIKEMILGTKDQDYIKNCIKDREKFGFNSYVVRELILGTKDQECIKNCIEQRERFGFSSYDVREMILGLKDQDDIKKYIKDRKKFGFKLYDIKKMILEKEDKCLLNSCIKDRKKLGLDSSTVVEMILVTGDLEYIEEYVRKGESLNLEQEEIDRLSLFTKKTNINLPPEMTIGVEIETEENGKNNAEIRQNFLSKTNWSTQRDNSLINGIEIVSPILTGNTKISSDEIRRVCAVLSGVSQTTSERCGGHIHIGANYLTSKQDWVNLIQIWTNSEKVLYIISNEKGKIPRNVVMEYALPISRKIENAIQTGTISLEGEEDLNEFISTVSKIQDYRTSSINFKNVGNIEKNTIEFRLSNGTLNPNTWIENINLFGGIVRSAHEISIIQGKLEEQRTKEERKMIENFEVLQTEQNDKKVAKSLIELCISPEERQVYMDRYTLNKQLLEKNAPEMESAINMQISTNKIVNKIFSGKNAVKGEDYKQVVTFIENDLERSEIMQGKEKWE